MKKLFEKKSYSTWAIENIKSFLITDSLKRISRKNQLQDYKKLLSKKDSKLWDLHKQLEEIRLKSYKEYEGYDYGNGYYYQSYPSLYISGYRDTDLRIKQLNLEDRLKGKTVLDIGSNTGFLLLSLAKSLKSGTGIEFNQFLVDASDKIKEFLEYENINFFKVPFEDYKPNNKFDTILSLANHSTYDGNTKQNLDQYFKKIASLLEDSGVLIFESHPPQIEPEEQLKKTKSIIENYFDIIETPYLALDSFLDKNRSYFIAKKKKPIH